MNYPYPRSIGYPCDPQTQTIRYNMMTGVQSIGKSSKLIGFSADRDLNLLKGEVALNCQLSTVN